MDMAFWAKLMFWASALGVLSTFAGLLLIWRTLHHTRRAADYALDMVREAEEATAEARAATKAAQTAANSAEQTLHSNRAWVMPTYIEKGPFTGNIIRSDISIIQPVSNGFVFSPQWKNWGQSPLLI